MAENLGSLGFMQQAPQAPAAPAAPVNPYDIQGNFGGRGIAANQQAILGQHDGMIFTPNENVETKQAKFLQNMAYYGGGPQSQGQLQLQSGMGQAMGQAQAMAASQRGINPALAARLAAQQQANLQQNTNVQAAALRSQEQMQALGMLQQTATGQQNFSMNQMNNQAAADRQHSGVAAGMIGGALQGGAAGGMSGLMSGGARGAAGAGSGLASRGLSADSGTMAAAHGALVPGQASKAGDSPSNDTVPAMLSPGEAVIPRSVMQSENPGEQAKEFIEQLKSQKSQKKGEAPSFAKLFEMHKEMGKHLEKLCKGGKV
jgi:hypothetical protein